MAHSLEGGVSRDLGTTAQQRGARLLGAGHASWQACMLHVVHALHVVVRARYTGRRGEWCDDDARRYGQLGGCRRHGSKRVVPLPSRCGGEPGRPQPLRGRLWQPRHPQGAHHTLCADTTEHRASHSLLYDAVTRHSCSRAACQAILLPPPSYTSAATTVHLFGLAHLLSPRIYLCFRAAASSFNSTSIRHRHRRRFHLQRRVHPLAPRGTLT